MIDHPFLSVPTTVPAPLSGHLALPAGAYPRPAERCRLGAVRRFVHAPVDGLERRPAARARHLTAAWPASEIRE